VQERAPNQAAPVQTTHPSPPTIQAYFFYGDGCSHCDEVKPLLSDLSTKYPELHITMLEIYHNATNLETFSGMTREYGVEGSGIPVLFIGDRALIGDTEIKNQLEERVLEEQKKFSSGNSTGVTTTVQPGGGFVSPSTHLTVELVVLSALVDSINPCAFSVLIFLLISIIAVENRKRILLVGGTYTAAVFLFYLLSGLGLFSIIHISGLSLWLSLIGATVAIVLGAVNVIDVIRKKEGFLLAIPESRKEMIGRYIKTASLPAAFALGILVGIFELPCTGGIYLAILGLMSRDLTLVQGLPWLILYNLVFVMPLIVILLVVAFGIPPEQADAWRIKHRRTLRLVVGIVMIALGIFILYGWVR